MEKFNNSNSNPSFLVFADIDKQGFIIGVYPGIEHARIIQQKIWQMGAPPTPFSLTDIVDFFEHMDFGRYLLDEEHLFESLSQESESNGYFTVGTVKLEGEMTVQSYIDRRTLY